MANLAMEDEGISAKITLNDGNKMPLFGLGSWKAKEGEIEKTVSFALKNGYCLLDTAKVYGRAFLNISRHEGIFKRVMANQKIESEGFSAKLTLNDGNKMPLFGLGVFRVTQGDAAKTVSFALQNGYRLLDTAAMYGNEGEVGMGVRNSGVKREDVFVVTKLSPNDHGYEECLRGFDESFKKLDLGYIDLYLIHTPSPGKIVDSYKAMLELKAQGLVRSIGVSNFGIQHLEGIRKAGLPTPAVNQIELHPYWRLEDIVNYCLDKGIAVMGYCPIIRARKNNDPVLVEMAAKYNKSVPQLLICWSIQKKYITIPKSSNCDRILENSQVFDFSISEEDMKILNTMTPPYKCTSMDDPTVKPWIS